MKNTTTSTSCSPYPVSLSMVSVTQGHPWSENIEEKIPETDNS